MIIDIGNIIIDKIKNLPFIDKYGGVVKPVSYKTQDGEKFKKNTFPIDCNINPSECDDETYTDLCPDNSKKSVTYLEGKNVRFVKREGALYYFQATYDLICWLNIPALGETDCSISSKAIMSVLSVLPQTPANEGLFQRLLITPLGQNSKDQNPFAKYSYDIEVHQLLMYPYDYFVMPLQVDFVINKKCLTNWDPLPSIACLPDPVDPLTLYNFCLDEIFDRLTAEQIQCLTDRLCTNTMYKELAFTGAINGVNDTFVCVEEIVQIFKDGQLLFETADYVLSLDKKTATLLVAPSAAFGNALKFFGNI